MGHGFLATSNKHLCVCGKKCSLPPRLEGIVISQCYNRLALVVICLSKQLNLSTPKLHWLLSAGHHHALRTFQIAIVVFEWKKFSCVFEVEKVLRREQFTPCLALI